MRHQTQGQINLNLQRVALVSLTLLFLLVSLESFSASTKFGQACKFSLMKPQRTSDEFSFDFLDSNYVIEKDTGRKYELSVAKSELEKRISTRQECGTCYAESAYNGVEKLVEQVQAGQISIDRIDFLSKIFSQKLETRFKNLQQGNTGARLSNSIEYLLRWNQKLLNSSSHSFWQEFKDSYDYISSGNSGDIFKKSSHEHLSEEVYEVNVLTVPRKTQEDVKFEDSQVLQMNSELIASTKSVFDANVNSFVSSINLARQRLWEESNFFLENSRLFAEYQSSIGTSKKAKLAQLKGVNKNVKRLLQKIFQQQDLTQKLSIPEDLVVWIRIAEEFEKMNSKKKKELLEDPWLAQVYNYSFNSLQDLKSLDENNASRIRANYQRIFMKFKTQSQHYWNNKLQQQSELIDLVGEKVLRVSKTSTYRSKPIRLIEKSKSIQGYLLEIEKSLAEGSMLGISFTYNFANVFKPNEQGAEFRVLDRENPKHPKGKDPITGEPYFPGGGHGDMVLAVLRDPQQGNKITHLVLQGSHGSSEQWNGKYLMTSEYFLRHAYKIESFELIEIQDSFVSQIDE